MIVRRQTLTDCFLSEEPTADAKVPTVDGLTPTSFSLSLLHVFHFIVRIHTIG